MKKKLALLLSLAMVLTFTLAACGSNSGADLSDSQFVGDWVAQSVAVGDEAGELEGDGTYTLTLNGDGTGRFVSKVVGEEDEVSDITWELTDEGFKTKGDTKLKFTDNGDGTISAKVIGVSLIFVRPGELGPDDGAPDIGTQWGYMGQDPVECAVWQYLAEDVASEYGPDDKTDIVSVPVVSIIKTEEGEDGDTHISGDFWVYNYKINGDTLECVSGGSHPGMAHVAKDGDTYKVVDFEGVKDGGDFEPSAKEIFGDDYDKFTEINGDSDARDALRDQGLADYVKTNGLAVTKYQDEGWDPVELAL